MNLILSWIRSVETHESRKLYCLAHELREISKMVPIIDIALFGNKLNDILDLSADLEDLRLPNKFDLVILIISKSNP